MVTTDYDLRPIWDGILEIYEAFDAICSRHGIRFYAAGGTMIGAVRHHGFIPWDDDLDLLMPVEDFKKFEKIAAKELPPYFRLITWGNTPGYRANCLKIVDLRMDVLQVVRAQSKLKIGQGLFIDIFLINGVPRTRLGRFSEQVLHAMREIVYSSFCVHQQMSFRRILILITGWLLHFFIRAYKSETERCMKIYEYRMKRPVYGSKYCGALYGASTNMYFWITSTNNFATFIRVKFDRATIPLPVGFHSFLGQEYGRYWEFPPENQRVPHHVDLEEAPWLN